MRMASKVPMRNANGYAVTHITTSTTSAQMSDLTCQNSLPNKRMYLTGGTVPVRKHFSRL